MYVLKGFKCATLLVILLVKLQPCKTQFSCLTIQNTYELSGTIKFNFHRNDKALNIIVDVPLLACLKECLLRSHCGAIVYERLFHLCRLFDGMTRSPGVLETKPGPLYIDIQSIVIDQLYLGACRSRDCPTGFRCKDVSGQKECEPSECPRPPNVANAELRIISQAIGTRAKYFCRDGFKYFGKPVITCENNLTWSDSSFRCVEFMRLANLNVEISIVRMAMNFTSAGAYCAQLEGSRLMKIDSEAKYSVIASILQGETRNYYIDGHYNQVTNWTYHDGEPANHCCWNPGEPNNLDTEHCIVMVNRFSYNAWNNVDCSRNFYCICEIKD